VEADMIVMGTHGRKGVAHLLSGSVAEDVVNHTECPIWTYSLKK
jgi:nucleotide-binding universal stress UspA family protein